jgi:ribosome biogenesis GTPase
MDLKVLGFDEWFAGHADAMLQADQAVARVMSADRGAFLVQGEQGETVAELSGKFRFEAGSGPDLPCVGDWVCVAHSSPTLAIIHAVLPRKTFLRRKSAGKSVEVQMIATNLDVAFIVQSCHFDFNIRRLDRYLVAANEGKVTPIIILSKTDLVTADELTQMVKDIREAGISTSILPLSNATGSGLEAFRDLLQPGKTFCLLGSSGVGKTTLVNKMIGKETFFTKEVSKTGEGMHATTRRQLLALQSGALLLDTPGMRELGVVGSSDGLDDNFADIHDLSLSCRFSNCTHSQEPGCAVLLAIEEGTVSSKRHESYLKLTKENEHHDRSYAEKRKKGKDFSRLIKSAKKKGKKS